MLRTDGRQSENSIPPLKLRLSGWYNNGIQDIDLTDTFIGQSFHDEISKSLSPSQTDFNNQRSDNDLSPSILIEQGHDLMSRS